MESDWRIKSSAAMQVRLQKQEVTVAAAVAHAGHGILEQAELF